MAKTLLGNIKGKDGTNGKSAYEIAVENGFTGTEEEWLKSLKVGGVTINGVLNDLSSFDFNNAPEGVVIMFQNNGTPSNAPFPVWLYEYGFGTLTTVKSGANITQTLTTQKGVYTRYFANSWSNWNIARCRYCIHAESYGNVATGKRVIKNCVLNLDNTANESWSNKQCIAGGFASNDNVEISGVVCAATGAGDTDQVISYHNSSSNGQSRLIIKDCICATGTIALLSNGTHDAPSICIVSGA